MGFVTLVIACLAPPCESCLAQKASSRVQEETERVQNEFGSMPRRLGSTS